MSKRNPFNAPKRVSTNFTVTREDRQLDPINDHLPDSILVKPIPCGSGRESKFRLAIVNSTDKIRDLRSLADQLKTAGGNLQVSTVENILNTLLDVVPRYMAETGNSVRIGNLVTLKACVTGRIDNANDDLDPEKNHLEIHATVSPALRHSLAKARLVNVKNRRNVIDRVIREMNGAVADEVDAENVILINGRGIYVPKQSATDENTRGRVWIETLEGEMLGRCEVLSSGPDLLRARFKPNARVVAGVVRLVVETYGSKEAAEAGGAAPIARYSREVRIVG
jgi:hypothetical protein